MRALILIVLLGFLQLVPTTSALFPENIAPAPLHIGDRLLYSSSASEETLDAEGIVVADAYRDFEWLGDMQTLVTIDGPTPATDEYGIQHDTVAFDIERARGDNIVSVERCYLEPQMGWSMRWDHLQGGPSYGNVWEYQSANALFGAQTQFHNTTPVTRFRQQACDAYFEPPAILWGPRYEEGEILNSPFRLTEGFRVFPITHWTNGSLPARSASWQGNPALEYEFPLTSERTRGDPTQQVIGSLTLMFADGFPGVVTARLEQARTWEGGTQRIEARIELVGYEPGSGAFPYEIPWRSAPEVNPQGTFVEAAPLAFMDRSLALAYPYDVAFRNLASDPTLGFGPWLAQHPEAFVVRADYDVDSFAGSAGIPNPLDGSRLGLTGPGWSICLSDATERRCATSAIPEGAPSIAARNAIDDAEPPEPTPPEAFEILAADEVSAFLTSAGIDVAGIRTVSYWMGYSPNPGSWPDVHASLQVSEVGWGDTESAHGRLAYVDLTRGALLQIDAVSVQIGIGEGGLLSDLAPPQRLQRAEGTLTWAPIRNTIATTVATITGIAVLAFLIKVLLVPLFTRLRRDRLLDNPVRARMFEVIRSEPGIHLAELEGFLAIGKGATKHHVDQLVAHKLVFVLDDAGYARCYASGHVPVDVARRLAVLRAGSHARVYELYAARPALSLREAARELAMSAPSVHRAKKRLEKEGLLPVAPNAVEAHLR